MRICVKKASDFTSKTLVLRTVFRSFRRGLAGTRESISSDERPAYGCEASASWSATLPSATPSRDAGSIPILPSDRIAKDESHYSVGWNLRASRPDAWLRSEYRLSSSACMTSDYRVRTQCDSTSTFCRSKIELPHLVPTCGRKGLSAE